MEEDIERLHAVKWVLSFKGGNSEEWIYISRELVTLIKRINCVNSCHSVKAFTFNTGSPAQANNLGLLSLLTIEN